MEREADQLLVSSHDDQTFNVYAVADRADEENQNRLRTVETFRENGGTIYEMDVMSYKESHILLTTCKDQPVHLRRIGADGTTTLLAQQLVCRNNVEEVISPITMKALPNSTYVATGHMKGLLRLLDIEKPSTEAFTCELKHAGRRIKIPISTITQLACDGNALALGCYAGDHLYFHDRRALNKQAPSAMELMSSSGVSCVKSKGNLLVVGCRKRDPVYVYDIRKRSQPVLSIQFSRGDSNEYTNQRFYFDVSKQGVLYTGNPSGHVLAYDLSSQECTAYFAGHFNCIPAVSYNNAGGILATASGSRTFETESHDSSSSETEM